MAEKTSETSEKSRKGTSRKKATANKVANVTPISQAGLAPETNSSEPKETKSHPIEPIILERIRFRAYELFVERGGLHGFDLEDWARAEAEILAKFDREKSA